MREALELLSASTKVLRVASLYRSSPDSPHIQPDFFNTAATLATTLDCDQLLAVLKKIEHRLGRRRTQRWGPRPIDLDLLLMGSLTIDRQELCLPHPRLTSRPFALIPLAEIAGDWPIPGHGTVSECARTIEQSLLSRIEWPCEPIS